MRFLERFTGSKLPDIQFNVEDLSPVVDKLLLDLKQGFVQDIYSPPYESPGIKKRHTVVLKNGRRKFIVVLINFETYEQIPNELSITEFETSQELISPSIRYKHYISFFESSSISQEFILEVNKGSGNSQSWSSYPIELSETGDLLQQVASSTVDHRTTRKLYKSMRKPGAKHMWGYYPPRWPSYPTSDSAQS